MLFNKTEAGKIEKVPKAGWRGDLVNSFSEFLCILLHIIVFISLGLNALFLAYFSWTEIYQLRELLLAFWMVMKAVMLGSCMSFWSISSHCRMQHLFVCFVQWSEFLLSSFRHPIFFFVSLVFWVVSNFLSLQCGPFYGRLSALQHFVSG